MNSIFVSTFVFLVALIISVRGQIAGGISEVSDDQAEEIVGRLNDNIHQLKGETLKLIKVTGVTQQVVAGMLYNINGIFEDAKGDQFSCQITIWERSWLDAPDNLIVELKSKEQFVMESKSAGDVTSTKIVLLSLSLIVLTFLV